MIAQIINPHQIEVYDLSQFDAYAIMHSGQVFRYQTTNTGFTVWSAAHWAELRILPDKVIIKCDDAAYFYRYFDLTTDYRIIKNALAFPKLQKVMEVGGGIRILQGDWVEMVISFIISANNNIKRFTKTLNALCESYGTQIAGHGYAFPTLTQLATITVADWRALGCGYRDQYLMKAVQQLGQMDFTVLQTLSTDALNKALLAMAGVGPKVAACIMLFAFHRLEVAPIDTWLKKAITQLTLDEQAVILHGQYAGVAQQYIFYALQHLHQTL